VLREYKRVCCESVLRCERVCCESVLRCERVCCGSTNEYVAKVQVSVLQESLVLRLLCVARVQSGELRERLALRESVLRERLALRESVLRESHSRNTKECHTQHPHTSALRTLFCVESTPYMHTLRIHTLHIHTPHIHTPRIYALYIHTLHINTPHIHKHPTYTHPT